MKVPGSRAWHRGLAINRLMGNFTGNSWRARLGRGERDCRKEGRRGEREREKWKRGGRERDGGRAGEMSGCF